VIISSVLSVAIVLLQQTAVPQREVRKMHGYLKLVFIENCTVLYRNDVLDYFNPTKSFGNQNNEILFSNISHEKLKNMASLRASFRVHGYNAFWLDSDRCYYIDNSCDKKVLRVSSGSMVTCDVSHEAHKLYDFTQDGNFLGVSDRFIFWSKDSTFFWRNFETGVTDSINCPKYVKALSGAIGLSEGGVAIFASGNNPSLFSGHPGWSGVLNFDFTRRSFNRLD
jgi:hypothetical protein